MGETELSEHFGSSRVETLQLKSFRDLRLHFEREKKLTWWQFIWNPKMSHAPDGLGSGYFVLQQQFHREKRGSDVICWVWVRVTWGGGSKLQPQAVQLSAPWESSGFRFHRTRERRRGCSGWRPLRRGIPSQFPHTKPSAAATFPCRLLPGLVSSSWAAADGDYATGFCVTSSESSCLLDHLPPMHHTPFCLFFHPPSIDSSWHEIAVGHLVVLGGGRTRVWSNAQGHD